MPTASQARMPVMPKLPRAADSASAALWSAAAQSSSARWVPDLPEQSEAWATSAPAISPSARTMRTRVKPMRFTSTAIAALAAAREVLQASWTKALHAIQATPAAATQETLPGSSAASEADSSGAAAPASPLPAALWQARWEEHVQQNDHAIRVFNEAVVHYNGAVAQFPANLLAWVFGFKAARAL